MGHYILLIYTNLVAIDNSFVKSTFFAEEWSLSLGRMEFGIGA